MLMSTMTVMHRAPSATAAMLTARLRPFAVVLSE
jgi:hypothetical protein